MPLFYEGIPHWLEKGMWDLQKTVMNPAAETLGRLQEKIASLNLGGCNVFQSKV